MIVGRRAAERTAMPAPSASSPRKVAGGTPAPPPGKADGRAVLHAPDVHPGPVAPAVARLSGNEASTPHMPGTVTATVVGARSCQTCRTARPTTSARAMCPDFWK